MRTEYAPALIDRRRKYMDHRSRSTPALDGQPEGPSCECAGAMENRSLFSRCGVLILHATLFNEEGVAKVGLDLAEQSATAGQQFRHFIRHHGMKATA